jgi:hypothetical protein
MVIGACRLTLRLPENQSLKGKRHVVKSIIARVKNKFNVSIAEIDDQDRWQIAQLGITCVSNNGQHVDEVLAKVVGFIETSHADAELVDYEIEILHAL